MSSWLARLIARSVLSTIGPRGRGTLDHLGLWDSAVNAPISERGLGVFVYGTLSKAFGGHGGIVPGSAELVEKAKLGVDRDEQQSPPLGQLGGLQGPVARIEAGILAKKRYLE